MFIEIVNERAKGELVLNLLGGPEVIPQFDSGDAVKGGVVDVVLTPGGYYEKYIPEVASYRITDIGPAELRKTGFTDLLNEVHGEKMNSYLLGMPLTSGIPGFYMWTTFKVENPRTDFQGVRYRTVVTYDSFFKKLGIVGVTMPLPDAYTAIERGLVGGTATTIAVMMIFSIHEVVKYHIDHPFYTPDLFAMVNLATWNRLPKHLQDLMQEAMIEIELEVAEYETDTETRKQALQDAGVEFITFSPADAKWFTDTAYDAGWEDFLAANPVIGPRLRELGGR